MGLNLRSFVSDNDKTGAIGIDSLQFESNSPETVMDIPAHEQFLHLIVSSLEQLLKLNLLQIITINNKQIIIPHSDYCSIPNYVEFLKSQQIEEKATVLNTLGVFLSSHSPLELLGMYVDNMAKGADITRTLLLSSIDLIQKNTYIIDLAFSNNQLNIFNAFVDSWNNNQQNLPFSIEGIVFLPSPLGEDQQSITFWLRLKDFFGTDIIEKLTAGVREMAYFKIFERGLAWYCHKYKSHPVNGDQPDEHNVPRGNDIISYLIFKAIVDFDGSLPLAIEELSNHESMHGPVDVLINKILELTSVNPLSEGFACSSSCDEFARNAHKKAQISLLKNDPLALENQSQQNEIIYFGGAAIWLTVLNIHSKMIINRKYTDLMQGNDFEDIKENIWQIWQYSIATMIKAAIMVREDPRFATMTETEKIQKVLDNLEHILPTIGENLDEFQS